MLTYRQPLRAVDAYDKVIYTNQSQAVIWAIGPVNKKVYFFILNTILNRLDIIFMHYLLILTI